MKTKWVRKIGVAVVFLLLLQLVSPFIQAQAATGSAAYGDKTDITGTDYLVVDEANSSLAITQADGTTPILPNSTNPTVYDHIPAGAKIAIDYAFNLSDGVSPDLYTYDGSETFTVMLPRGIDFTSSGGTLAGSDGLFAEISALS